MYDRLSRYYDLSHAALTDDIPFMLGLAAETGGPILELGCGSGRLLLPLARAGHPITGVDNSPAMLAIADQRLAQEDADVRARVRLVTADIAAAGSATYLAYESHTTGLTICGVNTFMHLDQAQALATLRTVSRLLRPDGLLCIDVDNPFALSAVDEAPEPELEQAWTDPATGRTVRQLAAYRNADTDQAVDVTWVFEESSGATTPERTVIEMRYHYLYPHQLDLLISQSGLRLMAFYGDYDRAPFDEDSDRLLLMARPV